MAIDAAATPDSITADAPPDAAPCGLRAGERGKTMRMLNVDGLDRTYIVYLPDGVDPTTPIPLVFVHHGYTMAASDMYDITGYPALADREKIALAFPDGQGGPHTLNAPWNVGSNVCPSTSGAPPDAPGDDFAFLDAMQADIAQDQCIDRDHIYVTGFSMGGYFSHHAGCMKPGIRARRAALGRHPLARRVRQREGADHHLPRARGSADPRRLRRPGRRAGPRRDALGHRVGRAQRLRDDDHLADDR